MAQLFITILDSPNPPIRQNIYWRILIKLKARFHNFQQACRWLADEDNLLYQGDMASEIAHELCLDIRMSQRIVSQAVADFLSLDADHDLERFYAEFDVATGIQAVQTLSHPFVNVFNYPPDHPHRLIYQAILEGQPYTEALIEATGYCEEIFYEVVKFAEAELSCADPGGHLQKLRAATQLPLNAKRHQEKKFSITPLENGDVEIIFLKKYRFVKNSTCHTLGKLDEQITEHLRIDRLDFQRYFAGQMNLLVDFCRQGLVRLVCWDFDATLVPETWPHLNRQQRLPAWRLQSLHWLDPNYPQILRSLSRTTGICQSIQTNNFPHVVTEVFDSLLPDHRNIFCDIQGRPNAMTPGFPKSAKIRCTIERLLDQGVPRVGGYLHFNADNCVGFSPIAVLDFGIIDDNPLNCEEVKKRGGWANCATQENRPEILRVLSYRFLQQNELPAARAMKHPGFLSKSASGLRTEEQLAARELKKSY